MSGQGQNYTAEEHAAAWATYYAQQGYTQAQISNMLGTSAGGSSSGGYDYSTASGVGTTGPYPAAPASVQRQMQSVADSELYEQSSIYTPEAAHDIAKSGFLPVGNAGGSGSGGAAKRPQNLQGKRETVVRKGNGRTWEDPTLLDWDPKWYRLFVGDLSNDVNERTLDEAFGKYTTYCKCKVVRDRLSLKAKYGFIAFKDPEDFLKAWKEMDGKYVGNRPITLTKVKDDKYGTIATTSVSGRKARELDKLRRNHGKPLNGRPTPW